MRKSIVPVCGVALALLISASTYAVQAQDEAETAASLLNRGAYMEARIRFGDQIESGADVEGYFETYLQTGGFAEGLQQAEVLLDRWPESPYVHYMRGRLLVKTGDLDSAERAFQEAIKRKGDFWRAGLALADLYAATGRDRRAQQLYGVLRGRYKQGLFISPADLGIAGRAAAQLEEFHDANEALRAALDLDGSNLQNLLWRAELFGRTYDDAFARELYQKAIAINPHWADLYVGHSRVTDGFAAKEELAHLALEKMPVHTGALEELARIAILDGAYADAAALLDRALSVNPSSVSSLAHLGAAHYLKGHSAALAAVESRALEVDAESAAFHRTISEDLTLRFRYPAAADFAQKAVRRDPGDAAANAALGAGLLRLGRRGEARRYLERSYESDAFNLYVANTLSLLDAYADFEEWESEHFRLLIHRDESAVLGSVMLREAERAYAAYRDRYPYRLTGKIQIEAYNDPDDFAVRVAGIPHIGLLGVSFGDVIALNTPRAQQGRPYNWARTLWHEIAHTMAIGTSRYHVPRWLTEGLSVYEETRADKAWSRKLEPALLRAFEQGHLHALDQMDRGFTRPAFPGQILLSYYHASEVVAFVADRHGFGAIVELLQALSRGLDEEEAVRVALGESRQSIDRAFRNSLRARLDSLQGTLRLLPNPLAEEVTGRTDSPLLRRLETGMAALSAGDLTKAESSFKAALELYPAYVGANNPYAGLAEVYRRSENKGALMDILPRYISITEYGAVEARELAELFAARGDVERSVDLLERTRATEPYDIRTLLRLAELQEEIGRYADAVGSRRAVIALDPVDRANAFYRLARTLYELADLAAAKRAVLQSLELAPSFRDAQRFLLACVAEAP